MSIKCIDYAPFTKDSQTISVDVFNPQKEPLKLEVSCNDNFYQRIDVTDGVYRFDKEDRTRSVRCVIKLLRCVRENCTTIHERVIRYLSGMSDSRDGSRPVDGVMSTYLVPEDVDTHIHEMYMQFSDSGTIALGYDVGMSFAFSADRPPIIAAVCIGNRCKPVLHIGDTEEISFYCRWLLRHVCNMGNVFVAFEFSGRAGVERIERLVGLFNRRMSVFADRTGYNFGQFVVREGALSTEQAKFELAHQFGNVSTDVRSVENMNIYGASGYGMAVFSYADVPKVKVYLFPYFNTVWFGAVVNRLRTAYIGFALNDEFSY